MNLNDPLLQFIMQQLAQAEAGGAPPVQGITPALQQGAIPVSSGPMTTVGLNQPLNVSPERAATLSPLERQLSQAANMRAFAEPDQDRLAFEQNTLGFLDAINQQNTGVYDRRMQAQAMAQKEAADREMEMAKASAPKLIEQETERLKIAANSSKDQQERAGNLDKTYLDALGKIGASDSVTKQQDMANLRQLYHELRAPKSAPRTDPIKALIAEVDKERKAGKTDDQIRMELIAEAEAHPELAGAARAAIDYLGKKPAATPRPAVGPTATANTTAARQGSPYSLPPLPDVPLLPRQGPYSAMIPQPSPLRSNPGTDKVSSALLSIQDSGGEAIPPDRIVEIIGSAKKQYQSMGKTGYTFPEWVARNIFGTVDYKKVENLINIVEGRA